jgi:exonuclease SbcD
MSTFRFIHCADLHIDSPLRGLEADPDAPVSRIRNATRDAFVNLVGYAIANRVDFVLAAGDLYDGEWQDWRTGQFLIKEVSRLSKAHIPFIAISGNHDAESVITRQIKLLDPAHQFGADKAGTWPIEHLDVLIHGQSFKTAAVKDDLSKHYPTRFEGKFNIGLLHTNVDGRPGHEKYAPSDLNALRNRGYQYWALGHVHTRAILAEEPYWVVYPGNLQGRHIREIGSRGAYLVTVTDREINTPPKFVPFDTVRWELLSVNVSGAPDLDAALSIARNRLAEAVEDIGDRLLAARVQFTGATPAFAALNQRPGDIKERLRIETQFLGGLDNIWIESVVVNVTPPKTEDASLGLLEAEIESLKAENLDGIVAKYTKDLLARLPGLRDELSALDPNHPVVAAEKDGPPPSALFERARNLLRARLAED